MLHAGIKLVLAGSFSETFKRNAINNGLLVLESPQLVTYLRNQFTNKSLTKRTGYQADVDLIKGTISFNGTKINIPKVGLAAQELIVAGGLENWVKARI